MLGKSPKNGKIASQVDSRIIFRLVRKPCPKVFLDQVLFVSERNLEKVSSGLASFDYEAKESEAKIEKQGLSMRVPAAVRAIEQEERTAVGLF